MISLLDALRGKLIVSCQAGSDEPLHGAGLMAAMARAAEIGGAAAIRANGSNDIAAIRAAVSLPVIGINKRQYPGHETYITPAFEDAKVIAEAGAHMIALDGTPRSRPYGVSLKDMVTRIHQELNKPVIADVSCLEDALAAEEADADALGTTLAGYTSHGRPALLGPDLDFVSELVSHTHLPVIAEGRYFEPQQATAALARGALAVVVGTAITRPQEITRRFVVAIAHAAERG